MSSLPLQPPPPLQQLLASTTPPPLLSTPTTPTPPATTRKACDPCRLSKARCEPLTTSNGDGEDGTICQRCKKTGRKCVFGERSRRRKRLKTDEEGGAGDEDEEVDTKVSRLERKVSIIEARLGTITDDGGEGRAVGGEKYHTPATISAPATPEHPPPQHLANPLYFFCPPSHPKPKPKADPPAPDVLSRNIVDLATATSLYSHFTTSMLPHFPFFTPAATLAQCRIEKSVLFLAILAAAAASCGAPELHQILLEELYATLAHRVLRSGEKCLELVQAIATAVTWYNPSVPIEQSRLWMLTMQAATLAVEMNLGGAPLPPQAPHTEQLEEMKAFLVCYSCNASMSVVLRRPVFLRWNRRIEECFERVRREGGEPGRLLTQYVVLVRHLEEAAAACGVLEGGDTASLSPNAVAWVLQNCERRIAASFEKGHPWGLAKPCVEIARHGTVLQIFSVVFDVPGGRAGPLLAARAHLLATAHQALDIFLSTPFEVLRCAPFHMFSRTGNACAVLLRLASGGDGDGEGLRIEEYLSSLIEQLRLLLQEGGGSRILVMSLALAEGLRTYYRANIAPPTPAPPPPPPSSPPPAPVPPLASQKRGRGEEHEEEAVAAASILCGTPAAVYPPQPPHPQQQQQQQQQQVFQYPQQDHQWPRMGGGGMYDIAGIEPSPAEVDAFLAGVDGQIMMGGGGGFDGGAQGFAGWASWGGGGGGGWGQGGGAHGKGEGAGRGGEFAWA